MEDDTSDDADQNGGTDYISNDRLCVSQILIGWHITLFQSNCQNVLTILDVQFSTEIAHNIRILNVGVNRQQTSHSHTDKMSYYRLVLDRHVRYIPGEDRNWIDELAEPLDDFLDQID